MALLDYVYHDEFLADQFDDAADYLTLEAVNGTSADGVFWVGTPNSGNKLEADSNPGVDEITVSINDTSPGSGVEDSHIKLALTPGTGLDSAVAGDPLDIGTEIEYGTPVPVYYRWTNSTGASESLEIRFILSAIRETAI